MNNARYEFYPVVRRGYRPDSTFSTGTTEVSDAGTASVSLDVRAEGEEGTTTETTGVDLSIHGPGDVTNLDADQVVRMDPEPDTTDFSPNYFPLVEFEDPQLPWLFSPQRADDRGRNRPWLCLVTVPKSAVTFEPAGTGSSPVLKAPTTELPDARESWAWAHAQLVGEQEPETAFASRSTATVSRLLCPRNLDPKTAYRACVVPTFEPGRRAGLGMDPYPDGGSTVALAWTDEESVRLPVYHFWEFTTATEGDFEALAREIEPVQLGSGVGYRSVDVSDPGPVDLKLPADAPGEGTVDIGGALTAIGAEPDTYEESMQSTLRDLLNAPGDVVSKTDYGAVGPSLYGKWHAGVPELEPESVDTPEYYYPTWFTTLNTDPRHRVAAGYGTQVVRDEQDRLMASAWEQFGEVQEANDFLRRIQLSERILTQRHRRLSSLSTGTLLGFSSPVHAYALDEASDRTVLAQVAGSDVPGPLSSTTFRRVTGSTGPMARREGTAIDGSNLTTRLETGRLPRVTDGLDATVERRVDAPASGSVSSVAGDGPPPGEGSLQSDGGTGTPFPAGAVNPGEEGELPSFETPELPRSTDDGPTVEPSASAGGGGSSPTPSGERELGPDVRRALTALDGLDDHVRTARRAVTDLSAAVESDDAATVSDLVETPPTVLDRCESIRRNTFDPLTRAVGKVLADPRPGSLDPGFDRAAANGYLQSLHGAQRRLEDAVGAAVEALRTGGPTGPVTAQLDRAGQALTELARTSDALRSALTPSPLEGMEPASLTEGEGEGASLPPVGRSTPATPTLPSMDRLRETVLTELDPQATLPSYASEALGVDLHRREDPVEEVLAAPSFTEPAYRLLADLDQEYFFPGVEDVSRESVGVLRTNRTFVEAFMAGLNHEVARELQWRNYPTDRRGTYFRRFWDRRGNPDADSSNPEHLADIEPMHTWDENDLGENSPRDDHAKVVLLLRSELLRRFPNTDIFAAKAVAEEGDRVPALPDTHVTRDGAGDDVKFHQFRGTLDPDVTFFGFDLSPDQALYDPYHEPGTKEPDDRADEGWFFVLQEAPGETRFGMDVGTEADVGSTPPGITRGDTTEQTTEADLRTGGGEHGWSALSWAHLVEEGKSPDDVTYVDVDGSRPGREDWAVEAGTSHLSGTGSSNDSKPTYDSGDAATWGFNSAHMARATWQLPVRISIHADDMIPEEPPTETDWRNVHLDTPVVTTTLEGSE